MIYGTSSVPRVVEESKCRSCAAYSYDSIGERAVHATALMPEIPFGAMSVTPKEIDSTIFVNDSETKPVFPTRTSCQNYLTTNYIGIAPNGSHPMGTEFMLKCWYGNTTKPFRVFGTESGIRGYNIDYNATCPYHSGGSSTRSLSLDPTKPEPLPRSKYDIDPYGVCLPMGA